MPPSIPAPNASIRTKKSLLVRGEIWSAAIAAFDEHGFDAVTIEEIATRAGVSRRTFFRYFSSKEDVMASTVRQYALDLTNALATEPSATQGLELVRVLIRKVIDPNLPLSQTLSSISAKSSAARVAQFLEVPLAEERLALAFARHARRKTPGLEERLLASFTLTATALCVDVWLSNGGKKSLDQVLGIVFAAVKSLYAT